MIVLILLLLLRFLPHTHTHDPYLKHYSIYPFESVRLMHTPTHTHSKSVCKVSVLCGQLVKGLTRSAHYASRSLLLYYTIYPVGCALAAVVIQFKTCSVYHLIITILVAIIAHAFSGCKIKKKIIILRNTFCLPKSSNFNCGYKTYNKNLFIKG